MGKFYGEIGFLTTTDDGHGVYTETITKRNYYGDILSYFQKDRSSGNLNDDVDVHNKISIVSDDFAVTNIGYMKYVKWSGIAWKVNTVELAYPRLIITFGGIYNEPSA